VEAKSICEEVEDHPSTLPTLPPRTPTPTPFSVSSEG